MKEIKTKIDEVTIEGRRYVPAESMQTTAVKSLKLPVSKGKEKGR